MPCPLPGLQQHVGHKGRVTLWSGQRSLDPVTDVRALNPMETRLYFIAGDLASNTLLGGVVGSVCSALFNDGWSMIPAMLLGMVLGMVLSLPIEFVCGLFFGAFEVMLPMMLTGMAAGMVVSMAASMTALQWQHAALAGAAVGIATLAFTYVANALLTRGVKRWPS